MTVPVTATVANDSKNGGVQWAVSGGGTLTNESTTPPYTATYNAPASVSSPFTATVTATSVSDSTKSGSVQISVNPLPTVSTNSVPAGTAGTPYSATINASGGTSPFTWSMTGSLPPGLSMGSSTSSSVTISGTPTGGNGTITIKVADAVGNNASQALSFTINAPPALTVSTSSLAAGTMGSAYNQSLQATGGVPSYTWALTGGSLPTGLTLSSSGVISGTPSGTFTGTSNFTVTATDSQTPTHATASANLSISVSAPPLSVKTNSLAAGTLGTAYSATLQATGGITPYSWAVVTGSLPQGLSLNASTGLISGTPTGSQTGAISFTVQVTDSETGTGNPKTATAVLSITISAAPLSVTTKSLPTGVAGSLYPSATLQAAGGVQPYSWAVTTGSLPAGLTLNAGTGAITGSPTTAGVSNFTVTVTDSQTPTHATATANLSITINPALAITTTTLNPGVVGTAYSQTLQATGGITPYSWAVTTGSLPQGLSLNASTGAITGTPTGPLTGVISFSVTVTDSESPTMSSSANLSITITAPTLNITTTSLPNGVLNQAYNANLTASGGVQPYTWALTAGSLPTGLTLNANGAITGTPTVLGTSSFTVQVTDSETPTHQTATANLSITINNSAPLAINTTSLQQGVVLTFYTATLQASGGVQPYTWSISAGTLPAGLTLAASTGVISGTPTTAGTSNFTVKVTDSSQPTQSVTKALSITINAALAITTQSLPNGSLNNAYSSTVNATGGIQPYSWSITAGSLPTGLSISQSSGTISGTPTATGTFNFTVTVTDSTNATASQPLSITITAQSCPNNANLNGHYAFLNQGWTNGSTGEVFFGSAGSLVADGAGNITGGEADANDPQDGPGSATLQSGTYCIGSNNLGTMNLTFGPPFGGPSTVAFALDASGNGSIIEWDTSVIQTSGVFFKQDTTAFATNKFSGPYAMGLVGVDGGSQNRFAIAGAFTANGTANLTNGLADGNTGGSVSSSVTFNSTNFNVSNTGRGTVTMNFTGKGSLSFAFYVVNASQLLMLETDASGNPILTGQVLKQSGTFTDASLKGVSVIEMQALDGSCNPACPDVVLGFVTTDGAGNYQFTSDENDGGTYTPPGTPKTGTYTVSSDGRVTTTGGNHSPIFYLIAKNTAFALGTDGGVSDGMMEAQSGSNFNNNSLSGNYYGGSWQPTSFNTSEEADQVNLSNPNLNVAGYNNSTQGNGTGNPTQDTFSGTYQVSANGRAIVSQGGTQNGVVYIVSPTHFLFMETPSGSGSGSNPKLSGFSQ